LQHELVRLIPAERQRAVFVGENAHAAVVAQFELLDVLPLPSPCVRLLLRGRLAEAGAIGIQRQNARAAAAPVAVPGREVQRRRRPGEAQNNYKATCFFTSECHFHTS
jgi:hypothetical protein